VRVYLAGPIFSQAERAWLDRLAERLRAEGFDCFAPHEHLAEIADPTPEAIYALDAGALRGCDALLAWLDGPIVDDGTAAEIGAFAELVRVDPGRHRGIVGLVTDLRLERRRGRAAGDGLNLFVAGAIRSAGRICWSLDEAVQALGELSVSETLPFS
jgi:hypothetical protein